MMTKKTGFILKFKGSEFYFQHKLMDEVTLSLEPTHAWFTVNAQMATVVAYDLHKATRTEFDVVPFTHEEVHS